MGILSQYGVGGQKILGTDKNICYNIIAAGVKRYRVKEGKRFEA
jgi:hypothetical protein